MLRTYLYHINVPCSNAFTLRHQGHTIFKSTEDRSGYYTHQLEINWFPLCQTSNSPSFFIHMQYTAYTRAHRTWNSVHSTVTMQTVKPTHGNLFDWQFYSANIPFLSTVSVAWRPDMFGSFYMVNTAIQNSNSLLSLHFFGDLPRPIYWKCWKIIESYHVFEKVWLELKLRCFTWEKTDLSTELGSSVANGDTSDNTRLKPTYGNANISLKSSPENSDSLNVISYANYFTFQWHFQSSEFHIKKPVHS